MIIKRLGGSLAIAVSMLAFSMTAFAQACDVESAEIKYMADVLVCGKDGGQWNDAAIWQFKGKNGDGCEVHTKLAKLLYEERTDEPPPRKKGNNVAKGAANDLDDGKYQSALDQLQLFIDTIVNDAKLNPNNPDAAEQADDWVTWAMGMQGKVEACMPTP